MPRTERRGDVAATPAQLHANLTAAQLDMVGGLERFGWALRFVRREPLQPPLPVLFCGDDVFLGLHADGTMDETSAIQTRHGWTGL